MNSSTALTLALAGVLAAPAILAQTCNPAIRRSAPDARYVVNAAQGTVLDQQTGLIWKRCVEGRSGIDCGIGSPIVMWWDAALRQATASSFAGHKDWRLPNRKELESLVEVACLYPALNTAVFPNNTSIGVWSASTKAGDFTAWNVYFDNGFADTDGRGWSYAVRLVRGGQ